MLNADVISFREFVMHEPLLLSTIQGAVLEFLRGRDDAVLFGAQAVNAYVSEPRATQNVDIMSPRAEELAEELREYLSDRFHIAVRVREITGGKGFRIYQTRKDGNRHLVAVREMSGTPATEQIEEIKVLSPLDLLVSKIVSYHSRKGKPKSFTDRRYIAVLVLRFPALKEQVTNAIGRLVDPAPMLRTWREILADGFVMEEPDDDLAY